MDIASRVQHTLLRPDCTEDEVRRVVMAASQVHLAAVSVLPVWARFAVTAAASSPVRVSVPVGYPLGTHTASVKGLEARLALEEGAAEIVLVPNLSAFKSGRREVFRQDLDYMLKHCRQTNPDAMVQVLVYADLLSPTELGQVVRIVRDSGGHFILLGTYAPQPPSAAEVRQWLPSFAPGIVIGVMAPVRTAETARKILALDIARLATPWGIEVVEEVLGRDGEMAR